MEIKMISCENVKPYTPTPPQLQTYKLCMLDQLHPPSLVSTLWFYSTSSADHTEITDEHLKTSLSQTLTRFYPVAGRGSGDNETILCNDEGVPFYVAKVEGDLILSDLQAGDPSVLLPCPTGMTLEWGPTSNIAMIQVTHFGCGGVAVGVVFWHKLADATSVANFMKDWAATCTSSMEPPAPGGPNYDIPQSLFAPKQELSAVSDSLSQKISVNNGKYLSRRYVFDGPALRRLKDEASTVVDSPTRVEVVTSLLWKCYMIASLANDKKVSALIHMVNMRRRGRLPSIPSACFGNLTDVTAGTCANAAMSADSGGIFAALVKQTRDMFRKVDDEFVKRMCGDQGLSGFYENRKNIFSGFRGVDDCLFFSSWCGAGFYDVDFGWGRPIWVKNCHLRDSTSVVGNMAWLIDTKLGDGGSIEAWLVMEEKYVEVFDNIQLLKEYQS